MYCNTFDHTTIHTKCIGRPPNTIGAKTKEQYGHMIHVSFENLLT